MDTCPFLAEQGFCVRLGCPHRHPRVCDICEGFQVIEDERTHRLSREHLRATWKKGMYWSNSCLACGVEVTGGSYNFVEHYSGQRHAHVVLSKNRAHLRYPSLLPHAKRQCHACNRSIGNQGWKAHQNSEKHRSRTAQRTVSPASEEVLSARTDFGIVSYDGSILRSVLITLPTGISEACIESATICSPLHAPPFNIVSFTSESQPAPELSIRFQPIPGSDLAGHVRVSLELSLVSPGTPIPVKINHVLSGTIGDEDILRAMAAVSTYTPVKPKARFANRTFKAQGDRLPLRSNVNFVIHLPEYETPAHIRDAIGGHTLSEQEDALANILPTPSVGTHAEFWSALLHVEEMQAAEDLRQFDMDHCQLARKEGYYTLEIPGLAERRPSVMLGDEVKLSLTGAGPDVEGYAAFVHRIEEKEIFVRLPADFDGSVFYDVEFCISRSPFRRMHQALSLDHALGHVLFPTRLWIPPQPTQHIAPLDANISSNQPQLFAVQDILRLPDNSPPYIIFGPPGTGKTLVVVEAIRQILRLPGTRVLATAPSNFAADVIAERLASFGVSQTTMFRLNALGRPRNQLHSSLVQYSAQEDGRFDVPPIDELLGYRVIVSTCVSSSLLFATGAPRGHFTHVFVDEAGYAVEPEALVPVLTMADSRTKIVISGDPKQLGPIVRSPSASAFEFNRSFLERLMETDVYDLSSGSNTLITKLVQNYRSHPAILNFPNKKFYGGELTTHVEPTIANRFLSWDKLHGTGFPVVFHAIHGEDMREAKYPSYFNPHEISLVNKYVHELLEEPTLGIVPGDIGVISPYNANNKKLRELLRGLTDVQSQARDLKVGTVEGFQAQERPVIIVSTVRSSQENVKVDIRHVLGFVSNPKRLNVAITRARSLLIVIGDPAILSLDNIWNEFLHYVHRSGGWRGVEFDLPPLDHEGGGDLTSTTWRTA